MPSQPPHHLFPPFRLDPENQQLWHDKREVTLRPKTFEVLRYLVEHPGQLVTKAMLLDAVWPGVVVSDSMPATCVTELRKVLRDDPRKPRFIETVHRRGYRFIAKVATAATVRETTRTPPQVGRPKPIVVGRDEELARVRSWYSQVLEGQRRIVFVAGEAGIGKSTFIQAFLDSIDQGGAVRLGRGQCVEQYGSGEPYMPVLEALSRLSREPGGEQIIELLNRFAPTWLAQMPELLTRDERMRLQGEIQGITQQRMLREMTQAFEALSAEKPLVLLLEDLHWSDFSTLELIAAIARRSESARILIVGTYRPVEILTKDHPLRTMKQELQLHHYCEELRLKPLSQREVVDYLTIRTASSGSRQFETLGPLIHARTDGNPLFMVNMVDYLLLDAGLPARSQEVTEAEWVETLRAHRLDALRTISQMIERNLERLQPDEQAVLEGASVVGAEFSAAAVAAALERQQSEVEACFKRLSRREQFVSEKGSILWPDGTAAAGFRFHHALYQEVLYARLPVGDQVQLHRRIALREESGYGERAAEVSSELAHHYSCANDKQKAIQYFQLAGERALARRAFREAELHFRDALALVSTVPESSDRVTRELTLHLALGGIMVVTRGWSAVDTVAAFTQARTLAERTGEVEPLEVFNGLWSSALTRGELRTALVLADQVLDIAGRVRPLQALVIAHFQQGLTRFALGDLAAANQCFLGAVQQYREEDFRAIPDDHGVHSLAFRGISEWLLGYPDQALRCRNEADSLARRLNKPFALVLAHAAGFLTDALRGDFERVFSASREVEKICTELGFPLHRSLCKIITPWARAKKGEVSGAISRIREGLAEFDAIEFYFCRGMYLCLLGEALALTGAVDEALVTVERALENNPDERFYRPEILRIHGELWLKKGRAELAERDFRDALELAQSMSAKSWELRATTSLARLLEHEGRRDEAHTELAGIYNWFTEGFETADLKNAKAVLDELNRDPAVRRFNKSSAR